ncbi:MAG: hypothetical protein R3B45_00040 [Bdellovibrionota bacterium]
MNINIVGHTDDDGDEVSNLTLSQKSRHSSQNYANKNLGLMP